ncbi:hybrid sensor histidine kinase/response regulator [Burkholderia ubonensis]|uniref:hybrid sensor histidine kinase/response regulator n=1 Tax=Burkholderia ubonensis TaxID=101571 RepID=UPI00075777EC|nr:ATP-binding protein [Burkholderia ubonensis]KVN55600.1 hybrid sensor histidine kinase/response regulator [Burkholderia ubonensis]KWI21972.1 hybrid sensor histidine kinase/response regulator [Burkholderia ubonensis]KWI26202.1 hybrid sensor histidine kinase/response regulator [Burkholderia ubonensis]ODQ40892.1 hybrid sensor histidine kinase/response regulator [Burkholderia ubonensis]OJA29149.1 hybrid sensor histidine kinase/response regulator [Burkholderia ubonensis]
MPYSPLQSIRRYQSISMFGGGILVTLLILIACALGMASIVYGHIEAERRNFVSGKEETLDEIKTSETSFRNGVANTQLIWREISRAPDSVVDAFFGNEQRIAIKPYPSLVVGVPGQTGNRAEVSRYLELSILLSRICAASSINRGRLLEGYHYSTRAGVFGLVPTMDEDWPALATPERRARVLDALRIDFGDERPPAAGERPRVRWLPPYVGPVAGQVRIRIAAQAYADGAPFAVLVTEYAPEYLLSWLPEAPSDGIFFITTEDNRLVTMARSAAGDQALSGRLLGLDAPRGLTMPDAPVFRDGFVVFRSRLDSTGWILVYAISWTDVAKGVAWQAGTLAAATLLALAVMWMLLVRFYRRTLMPVYARSQRVFDSEELCRNVIEMAPIGLGLISRSDGRLMLASGTLTNMIARCGDESRTLATQVVAHYEAFLACGAPEGTMQAVLPLAGQDDAWRHLDIGARGARYQGEDVLIVAAVDVTAKRRIVRKLEEAVRAADSANAAKSSFLAAMSHEIRTPLNVILGNLELLERSALDVSQHGRVQTLRTSAGSLLALVNDILDFSKIEAGAMTVESIEFGVVTVIERELSAFAPIAKAKGLQLFCKMDASISQRMRGDPMRFAQVFGNLLNNAIKFTDEGRVTARVSIVDACGAPELAVEVEDTGIGISPEHQHKLFKAFSQVDASITRRYGGTGLGLALCARLVTAMGGRISVASEPGAGSCFTVRLPLGAAVVEFARPSVPGARALTLIAAHAEWRDFVLPHLRAWGFDVSVHDSPARMAGDRRARPGAVVLFGDPDTWSHAELDGLRGCASIIFATPDGPLEPYHAGATVRVSSYSLSGLRAALSHGDAGGGNPAPHDFAAGAPAPGGPPLDDPAAGAPAAGDPAPGNHAPGVPAVAAVAMRRGDSGYRAASSAEGGGALRVLVADDEAVHGSLLSEQLLALGCTVAAAATGQAVLESLAANDWDALLIAADMPDMRAHALAETVHGLAAGCDVLVVTSHLTPEAMRRYALAGVRRILTKPVTLAHLHGALAHARRRRDLRGQRLRMGGGRQGRADQESALHDEKP